jgi:hypothetical protein
VQECPSCSVSLTEYRRISWKKSWKKGWLFTNSLSVQIIQQHTWRFSPDKFNQCAVFCSHPHTIDYTLILWRRSATENILVPPIVSLTNKNAIFIKPQILWKINKHSRNIVSITNLCFDASVSVKDQLLLHFVSVAILCLLNITYLYRSKTIQSFKIYNDWC